MSADEPDMLKGIVAKLEVIERRLDVLVNGQKRHRRERG